MRSKIALSTTLTTLSVIVLVLAALTFMDNNTARNAYAGIVLLFCLFVFAFTLSFKPTTDEKTASYRQKVELK